MDFWPKVWCFVPQKLEASKQGSFSDQFDSKLMISAEQLQMNKPIASGNFGAVYRAHLTPADGSSGQSWK